MEKERLDELNRELEILQAKEKQGVYLEMTIALVDKMQKQHNRDNIMHTIVTILLLAGLVIYIIIDKTQMVEVDLGQIQDQAAQTQSQDYQTK